MFKIKKEKQRTVYMCPFCKKVIVSSKKTAIFYRCDWIDGCSECFILSIDKDTQTSFQSKPIQALL